jgi:large subunit ribosomal protein L25
MSDLTINAQPRTVLGKKSRRLRREGLLPAVIYGPAVDAPQPLQLDARQFEVVYRAAGLTQLVDLVVDGGNRQRVFIRDVQHNLLKRRIDHVDFYAANLNVETTVAVPVVLIGEAPVVARAEGVLSQPVTTVSVRALPANVPASFEVDLTQIETLNDDVRVSNLVAPEGVTLLDDPDTVLVSVTRAVVEEEEVAEEVEEAEVEAVEEGAEGAAEPAAEEAAEGDERDES